MSASGADFTSSPEPPPFPARPAVWQLRTRLLPLGRLPRLMGIVNVTPDSFSDGGRFLSHHAAVDHALQLVQQGADLLDIGGESTRPYADPVTEEEELRRVIPVIEAVCDQVSVPVSIDTYKANVAREAVAAGAEIINDVTGLEGDPHMVHVARQCEAGLCVMHMQGTPQTMQDNPVYEHVVNEIFAYLDRRLEALTSAGIAANRICLDPGIGFGKTHQHNLELLSHCECFHRLGCPILVGHSRKGFIAKVLGEEPHDRSLGTIAVALSLARKGVQILRVHDIAPVRQAIQLLDAVGGLSGSDL